jgi:hypothetical protein
MVRSDSVAPFTAPVEDMDINHRRVDVLIAKPFLNCPDIVTIFQQVYSECVP